MKHDLTSILMADLKRQIALGFGRSDRGIPTPVCPKCGVTDCEQNGRKYAFRCFECGHIEDYDPYGDGP